MARNGGELLAGERVLMTSDNDTLVLTNLRVRLDDTQFGSSRYISIMLDAVASCGLTTRSQPILLLIGAVALLFGITQSQDEPRYIGVLVGVLLVAAYFATRRAVITVSSTGGQAIIVPAAGMARVKILEFLQSVEEARLATVGQVSSGNWKAAQGA